MVILQVKRQDQKNWFLYETKVTTPVNEVMRDVAELHNMRIKVQRLAVTCTELAKHGPMRPEETRGLSSEIPLNELDINAYGTPTNPDEHGYRTGVPPPGAAADVLRKTAEECRMAVDDRLVDQKKNLTKEICKECLDKLYGAVMIAYPAYHRLPAYDPTRMDLENREELDGQSEFQDIVEPTEASIWWAGKEMQRTKILSDHIGKNEKTKVMCRLQHSGQGAPVREPRINKAEHTAMLAHYHQKQEESKKLCDDDDDSYLQSEWANSKSLKKSLVGGGNIRI